MATKIRLQRHGRKGYAFYKIVVADSRAPRDGKFIERIGSYNPNTNPATIDLNFERALYWIGVGAQPTDTARNILSREGVLMMKHLLGGVKKGAFDQAAAESKFEAWLKGNKDALNNMKAKVKEAAVADDKVKLEARLVQKLWQRKKPQRPKLRLKQRLLPLPKKLPKRKKLPWKLLPKKLLQLKAQNNY